MKYKTFDHVRELWRSNRQLISTGYDKALAYFEGVANEIASDHFFVHQFPTGLTRWGWRVPERWEVSGGSIIDPNGRNVITGHPLQVVAYSKYIYNVKITGRELLDNHTYIDPHGRPGIPFAFDYYYRDGWAFALTPDQHREIDPDKTYRVNINSEHLDGILKVGEFYLQGQTDKTIVIAAHLDHPYQANDGLSGVAVGMEIMRLLAQYDRYHTIRFIIVPEMIGSIHWLYKYRGQIPNMVGGVFLDALGSDQPLVLQKSLNGSTQVDKVFGSMMKYRRPFRMGLGNDERHFNAPGVGVPMVGISRIKFLPWDVSSPPFPEYHTSADTIREIRRDRLDQAVTFIADGLLLLDRNEHIKTNFPGEPFLTDLGLWPDYREDPEKHKTIFDVLDRADGTRTFADIAVELGLPMDYIYAAFQDPAWNSVLHKFRA